MPTRSAAVPSAGERMAAEPPELSDEALMERIQQQDRAAFAVLVRRHAERFYAVAYRTLLHRAEAEDVVQEAFLKLWNKPALWKPARQARFTTWFYRVVINACLDANRIRRPLPLAENFDPVDERQEEESQAREHRLIAVEEALATLPARQRTALNLCFYEGLSNQEAAGIMGVRVKALQSLIMRAKAQLKFTLGREEE